MRTEIRKLRTKIFSWFTKNGRHNLPWRQNASAWHILASEIMLQQTQVDRVITKYNEFVVRWPAPDALAKTPLQDFLQFWSGLGYNRRALNLYRLAGVVVAQHNNAIPEDHETLLGLPGVGRYTAAAVQSFAWNKNITLWDTNVRRIMLRVLHGGEFAEKIPDDQVLEKNLQDIFPKNRARDWHGALMDFGALICTSRKPSCTACPLKAECVAAPHFLAGKVALKRLVRPQSKFDGSLRQLRGAILREVTNTSAQRITEEQLRAQFTDARLETALKALKNEGFLQCEKGVVRCV